MQKTYILDTNILLHNPQALFAFEDNEVVIPLAVVEEIDRQKRRQDEIGRNAREVSRSLDQLREEGSLAEGVTSPGNGTVRIEVNHGSIDQLPAGLDWSKSDNRILAVSYQLQREGRIVHLVTKDLNLRIKADVIGIPSEDFYKDKVQFTSLYTGVKTEALTGKQVDSFHRNKKLILPEGSTGHPNEFFILKNHENPSQSALGRHPGDGTLVPLVHGDEECFGIRARNKEQRFALELLLNDEIKAVSLVGRAGTGKTLLAIAVGLQKVLDEKVYSRLLITRPMVPVGNDIGFLPGDKDEKLRPWMQPIFDNIEHIFSNAQENKEGRTKLTAVGKHSRDLDEDRFKSVKIVEHLIERGVLEMEPLTYIRGRSIPRQFIICDEAQNLSPQMIKTIVTRIGEGSKVVFTGDPEQIDHPYLDSCSNGLTYFVERFKGEALGGHVTLCKGERSALAELGSRIL
ncbi:MAG: PhoH family protein [Deltaproteobacteria bacterium]|nr:PhoH family protein [Deltaproteobacteria bacterium]